MDPKNQFPEARKVNVQAAIEGLSNASSLVFSSNKDDNKLIDSNTPADPMNTKLTV